MTQKINIPNSKIDIFLNHVNKTEKINVKIKHMDYKMGVTIMKKILALICALSLSAVMFTGCNEKDDDKESSSKKEETTVSSAAEDSLSDETSAEESSDTDSSEEESSEEESSVTEIDYTVNDNVKISDKLYDFEIAIDGDKIKLPMSVKDIEALGWEFDGAADTDINSGDMLLTQYFKKGNHMFVCNVANLGEKTIKAEDGLVISLRVDYNFSDPTTEPVVKAAKGITTGKSTKDDMIAAFGEPTEKYEDDTNFPDYTYRKGDYRNVVFKFSKDNDGVLKEITVENVGKDLS